MSVFCYALGETAIELWGVPAKERLRRLIEEIGGVQWTTDRDRIGADDRVLLVRADYLFEARTLKTLLEQPGRVLRCPTDGRLAAALVQGRRLSELLPVLETGAAELPADLEVIEPADLSAFDGYLRRSEPPLLEPVSAARRAALEDELYGNAYKGITDLVTKWLWPAPAKRMVRLCARLGVTPNAVTVTGVLLMLAAGVAFAHGHYLTGLAAGWVMTFLDTVDGKLARVTVRSSLIGHLLDHGMDLLHPPFWYVFWGLSLQGLTPILGLGTIELSWIIVIGYVVGRAAEGAFQLLGDVSIFTWRPFDAYFRLVTARRNPCLILLTAFTLIGRPDWAFVAVAAWTAGTTAVLALRLAQGALARWRHGPLESWLRDAEAAQRDHAHAFQTFASTRGAYVRR